MNLKCLSYLSFNDQSNTLKDDIKDSQYTSYFWWHGNSNPSIINGEGIYLKNSLLCFNLNRNISFRSNFTIDFLYNCKSTASYDIAMMFSEYTADKSLKYRWSTDELFKLSENPSWVFNKYRRYTWSSDGKKYRLFFDGKQIGSGDYISDKVGFYLNGHDPWNGGGYATGIIKYVALYALPITQNFDVDENFDADFNNLYGDNDNLYGYKKE